MVKKIFDILPPKKSGNYISKDAFVSKEKPFCEHKICEHKICEYKSIFPILKKYFLIIFVFFVIVAVFVVFSIYSKAEIEVWPKTEILPLQVKISLDSSLKEIDILGKAIPAEIIEVEKTVSEEVAASGKKMKEEKATGVVRIYNDYTYQQILVAGTRLQPPAEKFQPSLDKGENPWFKTKERVVIPPKEYRDVNVVADISGLKYNIESSAFSIPGLVGFPQYTYVYGKSSARFTGGVKAEISTVLQNDLDGAEKALSDKAIAECVNDINGKILDSSKEISIRDELIKTDIVEKYSAAAADSELNKFNYRVKAKSKAISFNEETLKGFVMGIISSQLPEDYIIYRDSLKIDYSVSGSDFESGKATLSLDVKVKIYPNVDEKSLKDSFAGKSSGETQAFLNAHPQITKVQINLWPFWVKNVAEDKERIKIKFLVD